MFEANFYFRTQRIEYCVSPSLNLIITHIKDRNNSNSNYFSHVNIYYHDNIRKITLEYVLTKEILDITQDYNELLMNINRIFAENIDNYIKNKEDFQKWLNQQNTY